MRQSTSFRQSMYPSIQASEMEPTSNFAGSGMALVFPTAASAVLDSVRPEEAGKASGATNAIREVGGVMGVAVLATIFSANGGYQSPQAFSDGVVAALPLAVVVLAIGAVLALFVPGKPVRSAGTAELRAPAGGPPEPAAG